MPGEVDSKGELCRFCRHKFNERHAKRGGAWQNMLAKVKNHRLILSKQDRIGTFHPKDEKNQDLNELTGDINYRKLAEPSSTLRQNTRTG